MSERLITPHDLDQLRAGGHITAPQRLMARQACREPKAWQAWAGYALITLAVGHLLAAIIFFFAFNWAAMTGATKLTVIGTALGSSIMIFAVIGRTRLVGQIAGMAASILTGVLFAVIGQIYQTGADAWQLFVLWAALSLPFALLAQNAVHGLIWLLIAHTGWLTFSAQYAEPLALLSPATSLTIGGLACLAILIARDWCLGRSRLLWLDYPWTRVLPALAGLCYLMIVTTWLIIEPDQAGFGEIIGTILFCIVSVTMVFFYGKSRDGFATACLAAAALTAVAGMALIRLLAEVTSAEEIILSLGTLGNLALLAVFAQWLKRRWKAVTSTNGHANAVLDQMETTQLETEQAVTDEVAKDQATKDQEGTS